MPRAAIGVDIGGTSVKLGLVSDKGKVLLRDSFMTSRQAGRKELLTKLVTHIEILKKEARYRKLKLAGAGIGAPGPIDVERGFVYFLTNISGWKNTPLKKILTKKIKMPVFVDNDANAMAWGEYCFGAGRGSKHIIALTLGTGVGGGIVMNGKLFHGPHYSAAEMGHVVVDVNGPVCGCGNRGCVETFVGNGYFVKDVREHLEAGGVSILNQWVSKEHRELTPKLVQEAARHGDKLSQGQWKKAGQYLGTALAGLVNVLNPERIILGGGMAQAGAPIFGPVRAAIKKKAFPIAARFVKVLPAKLGADAGLVGAAALAFFQLFLVTFLIFSPQQSFAEEPKEPAGAPIQVRGDTVEYFQEGQKAVGKGHVTIDYEGTHLEADTITVYMTTKMATAEGHVTLTQKGSTFKGDRAEYDFQKKIGRVDKMDAAIQETYYGKAQKIEKVEENHYRIVDSYVSTCCGNDPFYKLSAHNIDFFPDDKVIIRNAILFIRNIPILFIPYYEQPFVDFDRFPVHLVPGKRSEWGPFLLSKWRYNLVNRPDLTVKGNVLLDYRDKRGFGGGVENFYHGDKVGHGAVRVYYANDNNPPNELSSTETVNPNRDRYQWRHQSKLGESTTLTTEWNKLSDKDVVKDFFYREEYEKDVLPDNYISIITAKPEYTFSILDRERLDDFFTAVERSPELRFDTHNRAFADTPFYLREEVQYSNLKKTGAKSDTSVDVSRLDVNHTLSYAAHVGDISVTPRVGSRHTFYSRDAAGDRDLVRGTFDPGVDVSTHFYKTYDVYMKTLGLDINQMRHIFTPTLSYNYRPNPTTPHTLLQQFDALDAIDKDNFIRLNFENKLLVKNHSTSGELYSREFARVLPFLDVDLHTGRLENVGLDAELRPYTWLGIEADTTYNADTRDFDTANFDIYFTKGAWKVAVGQRYVQDQSSQTTAEIRFKLNEEWQFKLYDRYEFEEGDSKEFEFTVSKAFDCIIADFTYNRREGDTFYFVFRLKAFPSAPFSLSQSYNHPKVGSEL